LLLRFFDSADTGLALFLAELHMDGCIVNPVLENTDFEF